MEGLHRHQNTAQVKETMAVETTQRGLGLTCASISTSLDGSVHPMATNGCNTTYGLGSWAGESEVWFLDCPASTQNGQMADVVLGVYDPWPQPVDRRIEGTARDFASATLHYAAPIGYNALCYDAMVVLWLLWFCATLNRRCHYASFTRYDLWFVRLPMDDASMRVSQKKTTSTLKMESD